MFFTAPAILLKPTFLCMLIAQERKMKMCVSHLDPPANGQAVIFLTGLLEVFISEYQFWQQYRTTLSVIKPSMWSKDRKQT